MPRKEAAVVQKEISHKEAQNAQNEETLRLICILLCIPPFCFLLLRTPLFAYSSFSAFCASLWLNLFAAQKQSGDALEKHRPIG